MPEPMTHLFSSSDVNFKWVLLTTWLVLLPFISSTTSNIRDKVLAHSRNSVCVNLSTLERDLMGLNLTFTLSKYSNLKCVFLSTTVSHFGIGTIILPLNIGKIIVLTPKSYYDNYKRIHIWNS